MTTLTSFSKFPELPSELQFLIWERAFINTPAGKNLPPTMSKLRGTSLDINGALPKWNLGDRAALTLSDRAHGAGLEVDGKGLFFPLRTGIPDLLHACRDSRIEVLQQLKLGLEKYGPFVMKVGDRGFHERKMKEYYNGSMAAIKASLDQMKKA